MTTATHWPEPPSSGWWFAVHSETAAHQDHETVLATWYADWHGRQWLDELTALGKAATSPGSDNFHSSYKAKLADVRAVLAAPPAFRSFFEHQHHADRIAAYAPDTGVVIDVWDQG